MNRIATPAAALTAALAAVFTAALTAVFTVAGVAASAPAGCAQPVGVYRDATPWPQRLLAPERVWPLTTGGGVTVAVVGTGVDAANRQFGRDQVRAGTDVTGAAQRADTDCDGRGTFAAGIIGARPAGETTFAGIAPGVRILPVRHAQATERGDSADPDRLAAAIRAATAAGADVIYVVNPTTVDSPALDRAVVEARGADGVGRGPVHPLVPGRHVCGDALGEVQRLPHLDQRLAHPPGHVAVVVAERERLGERAQRQLRRRTRPAVR